MKTDEELRNDVMHEIQWDPALGDISAEIGVAAKHGVITLSGTVDSYRKKIAVEAAALRVSGVKVVASDVEVTVGAPSSRTDTDIAHAVRDALRRNCAVNTDQLEVKVDNGWVYLNGKVEWEFERKVAKHNVANLVGVRGVTTNISVVRKGIDTNKIQREIAAAFHRNATVDSGSITVETSGTEVILRGKVRTWAEMQEAVRVAWAAAGVTSVDNQTEIDPPVYA